MCEATVERAFEEHRQWVLSLREASSRGALVTTCAVSDEYEEACVVKGPWGADAPSYLLPPLVCRQNATVYVE